MIAVDNLDEVIRLIRGSENPKVAKAALMERFELDEVQAQAILDMRLQRLTNLEILTLRKEYEGLQKLIAELEAILADEKKLMKVIKKELQEVAKKYGDERRTTVEELSNVVEAVTKDEIIAEDALVTYTRAGLLRRMMPRARKRAMGEGAEGEADDPPLYRFDTMTDRTLYFFTNRGNCYPLSVAALPEMNRPKDRGSLLSSVLAGLEDGEQPVNILCYKPSELKDAPDWLFVTSQGQLKRTAAVEYDVRRQKFAALNLRPGDELLTVFPLDAESDVLLLSVCGMSIRFHADSVSVMGRVAAGVRGMTLDLRDGVSDRVMWCAQPKPTDQILLMTERGFAKRVLYMDFEPQSRGGKGVKCFYFNKSGSNGTRLAGAALLGAEGQSVQVTQKMSLPTVLSADEVVMQGKTDKGMPYAMAILDDVVTGMSLVESAPEDGTDA